MVDDETLRVAIYRSLGRYGAVPSRAELAAAHGIEPVAVDAAITRLAAARHVVLDEAGSIVMAHPFATIPLGFAVMGRRTLWWGGCAWDSFALPHLVPSDPQVLVSTRCPGCDAPLVWSVDREAPPEGDEVAHFLVPAASMWDDVVRTCGHQRLFCRQACVDAWLDATGNACGYVMDLATLWRLARGWYAGRLETGYSRRQPTEAAAYFSEVGLSGSFWGL